MSGRGNRGGGGARGGGLLSRKMHNPTFPKKHRSLGGNGGKIELLKKMSKSAIKAKNKLAKQERLANRAAATEGIEENYKPTDFYVDERLYIPLPEEMKGKLREAESSLCHKIVHMSRGDLIECMVGAKAYLKITNTVFLSNMEDYVRDFKAKFTEKLDYIKGLNHFSSYSPDLDLESQKILRGSIFQFLSTVNSHLLPQWLVPHEKGERKHVVECLAKALTNWTDGQKLVSKYADVPFSKHFLLKQRAGLGAFPPKEVADLLHGIGTNLTNFVGLLYVHVFRLFVKMAVDAKGMVNFYTLETWNAVKENMAKGAEASEGPSETAENGVGKEVSSKKRRSAPVAEEEEEESEKEKKKKRKRTASSASEKEDAPAVKIKKSKKEKKNDCIELSDDEPVPPFDLSKVKNEFNSLKVKKEKMDGQAAYGMDHMNMPLGADASFKLETGSRASSASGMPQFNLSLPPPVAPPPVSQFPDLDRVLSDAEKDPNLSSNWRNSLWMMNSRIRDLSGIKDNLQTIARNQETMIMQREQKIAEQDNTIRVLRQMLEYHNIRPPAFM